MAVLTEGDDWISVEEELQLAGIPCAGEGTQ